MKLGNQDGGLTTESWELYRYSGQDTYYHLFDDSITIITIGYLCLTLYSRLDVKCPDRLMCLNNLPFYVLEDGGNFRK